MSNGAESREWFCECDEIRCGAKITMTTDEYIEVSESGLFIMKTGHESETDDEVVEERGGYNVVRAKT